MTLRLVRFALEFLPEYKAALEHGTPGEVERAVREARSSSLTNMR